MLLRPLMTLSATLSAPRSPPPVASTEEVFAWLTDRGGLHRLDVGADPNGVRGLVTTEDADIGTVLLQVPLSATLADRGDGEQTLPGEPPEWCGSLPWNVQLAVCVLQHRADAASPWGAFLRSWPAEPPMLPKNLEPSELAEAQDPRFEADADGDYFWAEEQYFALCEAAEAAGRDGPPCTSAELRWALEMVWSRCLRLGCGGGYGVRRLLVPVLDLANHQAQPRHAAATGPDPHPTTRTVAASRRPSTPRCHAARCLAHPSRLCAGSQWPCTPTHSSALAPCAAPSSRTAP